MEPLCDTQDVLFVIPAYNEESNLPRVISGIHAMHPGASVLVVDDGSRDRTSAVAAEAGAHVVRHPFNMGIGATVQTGILYALEQGAQWVVRLDADGQHTPGDIQAFLQCIHTGGADLIVGSRFLLRAGYRVPLIRRAGIAYLSGLLSLLSGFRVTDATSGFQAFSRNAMEKLSRFFPDDYPEPELIILCKKWKLHFEEVPVTMNQRESGVSSITFGRSLYYMVKVTLAILLDTIRF